MWPKYALTLQLLTPITIQNLKEHGSKKQIDARQGCTASVELSK